uniref:Secreted protein n=1 Tax=Steinernema glaseri TaxID=37863 RepID=A0A1I7Y7C8_9BILA
MPPPTTPSMLLYFSLQRTAAGGRAFNLAKVHRRFGAKRDGGTTGACTATRGHFVYFALGHRMCFRQSSFCFVRAKLKTNEFGAGRRAAEAKLGLGRWLERDQWKLARLH